MSTDMIKAKSKELAVLMSQNMKSLESVLPSHMDSARFCRMAINCIMKNPDLAKCDPQSFVMAVINCGEMGLEPSLGQAALVPYGGQVQAQPMYQGLIELAQRSGKLAGAPYAVVVYENDEFEYEMGLEPKLKHVPSTGEQGDMKAVYAVAKMKDGEPQFVVLPKEEVMKIKGSSKAASSKHSPWQTWEPEMWKKTALKRLCKNLPKSSELSRAMTLDSLAESGKPQAPAMADMIESTLNTASLASESEIHEPLQKPEAKEIPKEEVETEKPKTAKKGKGKNSKPAPEKTAQADDEEALVNELIDIESEIDGETFSRIRGLAVVDDAEDPQLMGIEKVKELLQLYKALYKKGQTSPEHIK